MSKGRTYRQHALLRDSHPAIYAQIDAARNPELDLDTLSAGSGRDVVWTCPRGPDHVWPAKPSGRTKAASGQGCPFCANKRLSVTNSVAALYPDLAATFDPDLNDGLTADRAIAAGTKTYVWRCAAGPDHIWPSTLHNRAGKRTRSNGCPFCFSLRLSVTNSIAARYPHLAPQVDPSLNSGLTADQIIGKLAIKITWRCPEGPDHVWSSRVQSRIDGKGCPFCANKRLSVTNSLRINHPHLANQIDPTLNPGVDPGSLIAGGHQRIVWRCPTEPDHTWSTSVLARISSGSGCPKCASSGYRPDRPGYLYLAARTHRGVVQRKIGITNVPDIRRRQLRRSGWEELDLLGPIDGALARTIEQEHLRALRGAGIMVHENLTRADKFGGYTETWAYADYPVDTLVGVLEALDYDGLGPNMSVAA